MSNSVLPANDALRTSEERYRVLFELIPMAVYAIDAAGVIQEFNQVAAELWGRKPGIGDTDERFCGSLKLFKPDGTFLPHAQCPMALVVSGELQEARDEEVIIQRPDGSQVVVIVNIRPLLGLAGEIVGAVNCFYDVTQRARAEQIHKLQADSLADLNRRKDEFLAMLSHELRNPLAPIVNAVNLLGMQPNGNPVQEQARKIIGRQVVQLTRLVNDLMDVARVNTGRVHLSQEYVSFNSVVERAADTVRSLIDQRGHELTLSLPSNEIWLYADATRLEQIVVNLLGNAVKYTEPGGKIWVSIEHKDNHCELRVRDTGIGITPDLLPNIFDLFTQGEVSLARSQGGLGIGLALVKQLAELHHGHVEAISTVGEGSEFIVTLPTTPVIDASLRSATVEPRKAAMESLRVMIVDDNVDTVDSLALLLTALGHSVQRIYDGSGVVEAAVSFLPQIILLDIGLPGIDGYEIAVRLRKQNALKDTVLVALTGYGHESAMRLARESGFNHHMTKPADLIRLKQIFSAIPGAISSHHLSS